MLAYEITKVPFNAAAACMLFSTKTWPTCMEPKIAHVVSDILLINSGYLGGQIARQAWCCQGGRLDR